MEKKLLLTLLLLSTVFYVKSQTTHSVSMTSSTTFDPASLTINKGDIVVWTNNSSIPHTSTSGSACTADGLWDSGSIVSGGTFSHTFSTGGSFPYHCTFHCSMGMVGTITVNDVTINGINNGSSLNLDLKSFPNPFTVYSTLQFNLSEPGKIKVEVFDLLGKKIVEIQETPFASGTQEVQLPMENLSEGIFVCKIFFNGLPAGSEYLVKSSK